ncbi:MAG: hypothetical protein NTW10_01895 [Bacteroidetes bacterium]|jgi:hypothetical protein|nr:hypothetical protein [Bacteroidota bacterium]
MKKFLIWMVVIILLFLGLFVYWKYYFTYSEGSRAGLLQKFSYRGTVFKTYEGELVMSSVESNKNVALASEKFYFSVSDKSYATTLSGLEGHFVVVHYKQKNGILPWRGETEYIVDNVREGQ